MATIVTWFLQGNYNSVDYLLGAMPITEELLGRYRSMRHAWAEQTVKALERCNSFTFAKRGFSSSIGYFAFDLNVLLNGVSYETIIKSWIDQRTQLTFIQRYHDSTAGSSTNYYVYRLYGAELELYYSQFGSAKFGVLKVVDARYNAHILAPIRESTHTFSTYPNDARAFDAFYMAHPSPDWVSSTPVEYPTRQEQLKYWRPAFPDLSMTIPGTAPLNEPGISVSPPSNSAWEACRRIIEASYSTTFCDIQVDSATGNLSVVTNVPLPTNVETEGDSYTTNGFYTYKAGVAANAKFEVLFPLNRKGVWNTETIDANFRIRYQSPYTQPTRIPSPVYLAYYPSGVPSSGEECISIVSTQEAVPTRAAAKDDGPVGTDIATAEYYDFDYVTLASIGNDEVTKYLYNNSAFAPLQSKTITGFADPYTYGSVPDLICGARFVLREIPTTELFWGVRFKVRDSEIGLPVCEVPERADAVSPSDSAIHLRQLGEQAIEELEIPYGSWANSTEFKLYGHATYSSGDYTPVSLTTCDAIYGLGEAKLSHVRLDEDTNEVNSLGVSETHSLVRSRDLFVGVHFPAYQTNDGLYRPFNPPSLRVAGVQTRWNSAVSPSVATSATDMHAKFLAPYFGESVTTTGNITDPVPVIAFDRHVFRVHDVNAQDSYLSDELTPDHAVTPSIAFITSANRGLLGKTAGEIADGGTGTVNLYSDTTTQITYGPSSTPVTITARSLFGGIGSGKWVIVQEIGENWYIVNGDC